LSRNEHGIAAPGGAVGAVVGIEDGVVSGC
jgi:hypothetical protein